MDQTPKEPVEIDIRKAQKLFMLIWQSRNFVGKLEMENRILRETVEMLNLITNNGIVLVGIKTGELNFKNARNILLIEIMGDSGYASQYYRVMSGIKLSNIKLQ